MQIPRHRLHPLLLLLVVSCCVHTCFAPACFALPTQTPNLLRDGDFSSLGAWRKNEHLAQAGKTTLLPPERGVLLENPTIDKDASLYQDIATDGHSWFSYKLRIKAGLMMRASLGLVSLDAQGRVLDIDTPTRVNGQRWVVHEGRVQTPPQAAKLRVLLTVLDGQCSFADIEVRRSEAPEKVATRQRTTPGEGWSVRVHAADRPFWELFADDLDGDGRPELVGCDVDGLVTVRREGEPPFLRFEAGALVYQFASADLDGDGRKEILFSSVDPKLPVRAIDLRGSLVRSFAGTGGPERVAGGDLDGDGKPEVVMSVRNNVAGSGVAAGLAVYAADGRALWTRELTLRTFELADWIRGGGLELVAGGQNGDFSVFDATGGIGARFKIGDGLLEQFTLGDVEGDGAPDVVALVANGNRFDLVRHNGSKRLWTSPIALSLKASGSGASALLATGDFDPKTPGAETVVVGLHVISLVDATGVQLYQNRDPRAGGEYWEMWAPGGLNSPDIACWHGPRPQLFLSSSRFRHPAYYRIEYGGEDALRTYRPPDQEAHLETLHAAVHARTPEPGAAQATSEKIKVFMALSEFARAPEAKLREYAAALKALNSPALEHLVMYEASDLLGHERGQKMTIDAIVERARLFEKVGVPFGYFATHGGQVWLSREAIRRSKEAAPNMFRFLYIAENLETLYSPLYRDVLRWTDEALDFCAAHGMKMIFKEKHDVWGLLPSDPEVSRVLFSPRHREATVPIWATNQPYQPEVQLGGMLGLRAAGLCREFGMSTQYWNWHEWGRYPRGIRDVSPTYVCPSDIILRLELLGVALGGTWVHVEGGQTYLQSDPRQGVVPLARRHRDLVFELVRRGLWAPGAQPANLSRSTLVRAFHPGLEAGKAAGRKVAYPYYERNQEALRRGFIPARFLFETYPEEAFPRLAYMQDWNVRSCFPTNPFGWVPILPEGTPLRSDALALHTDGERVLRDGTWVSAVEARREVEDWLARGSAGIPWSAQGACLVVQEEPGATGAWRALLIDPGYLAPQGVATTLRTHGRPFRAALDMVTGEPLNVTAEGVAVRIEPGAFRLLRIEAR